MTSTVVFQTPCYADAASYRHATALDNFTFGPVDRDNAKSGSGRSVSSPQFLLLLNFNRVSRNFAECISERNHADSRAKPRARITRQVVVLRTSARTVCNSGRSFLFQYSGRFN